MKFLRDEKAVSEIVGALLILLIIVVYVGTLQAYEVPKWNTEIERQHFDQVYNDFVNLRSNYEDVSAKNIPKTGSLTMGVKYPERFMLRNPGQGASGILETYPIRINISYITATGTQWKNYTSMGFIYRQNGISESPELVYENGLLIKDYGNGHSFVMDDKQMLTTEDNIFIPIIYGDFRYVSTGETEFFNIQPISREGFQQVKFESMNVTIETRYPEIWKNLPKDSKPAGSHFTIENVTNCPYENSDCLKITTIPGYYVKKLNLPNSSQTQYFQDQVNIGMVSFDNSVLTSRGRTGTVGQDAGEKNQGRLDIPASDNATEFIIRDITLARSQSYNYYDNLNYSYDSDDINEKIGLTFSVTDCIGHLWTIEIRFKLNVSNDISNLSVEYVKQKYPEISNNPDIIESRYQNIPLDITNTREINLTRFYQMYSNISTPNALTIDKIDPEILYVNFVIN